jgi:hypothetical protein
LLLPDGRKTNTIEKKLRHQEVHAVEMISKTAISFDLDEIGRLLARGHVSDARSAIGRLIEHLDFMLTPDGPGNKKLPESSLCSADEFGRENVHAVRLLCEQASKAIAQHQIEHAQSILHQAEELWQAVPVNRSRSILAAVKDAERKFVFLRPDFGRPKDFMAKSEIMTEEEVRAKLADDGMASKKIDEEIARAKEHLI